MSVAARIQRLFVVPAFLVVSVVGSHATSAGDRESNCEEDSRTPNAARVPAGARPADAVPEIAAAFHIGDRPVTALGFVGDGQTLVVAEGGPARRDEGNPGHVLLYNLTGETPRRSGSLDATSDYVASLASSPSTGRWLAAGSVRWDQRLSLFHEENGDWKLVQAIPKPSNWWLRSLAFSPDERRLATVSGDPAGPIQLWTVGEGGLRKENVLPGPGWAASAITFSPDGRFVAAGLGSGHRHPKDGEILVWDVSKGDPRLTFQSDAGEKSKKRVGTDVTAIAWLPRHEAVAATWGDGALAFFRATDDGRLEERAEVRGEHAGRAIGVFCDRYFLTSGNDDAIACWSATGECLRRWRVDTRPTVLAIDRSGRHVAVGLTSGTISLEFR